MKGNYNLSYKDADLEFPNMLPSGLESILEGIRIRDNKLQIVFKKTSRREEISTEILKDFKKFKDNLREKLFENRIANTGWIVFFFDVINKNSSKFLPIGNQISEKEKKKKNNIYTYKITRDNKLYESIIIGENPYFLTIENDEILLMDEIDVDEDIVIKPNNMGYYPYLPYTFENRIEIEKYAKLIQDGRIKIDSLFERIRKEISKFVVQSSHVLDYITGLIIFSYFQDLFGTVPYTFFVSDNGNGKTVIGNFFEMLAYRTVNMTDPTPANIFRILGTLEAGQFTLFIDEAEGIDNNRTMMSILKTGYEKGKKVQRINQNEVQQHFHTYGIKLMAAERLPNENIAKGVLDRTFIISNYKGKPDLEIKEIKNVRNSKNDKIRKFLEQIRKILLVYRLINFQKPIANIETGLQGRNKEICKPMLQLFFSSNSQERIEAALEALLNDKQKRKENSLDKILLECILELVVQHSDGKIPFIEIWEELKSKLSGTSLVFREHEMETEAFGTISKRSISQSLRNKFGAKYPEKRNANAVILVFEDIDKIKQYFTDYSQKEIKIKCTRLENESSESSEYDLEKVF